MGTVSVCNVCLPLPLTCIQAGLDGRCRRLSRCLQGSGTAMRSICVVRLECDGCEAQDDISKHMACNLSDWGFCG